jgi:hypothetical protein
MACGCDRLGDRGRRSACRVDRRSALQHPDQRAEVCSRFIDKTPLVYNTAPWAADAHEVRAKARSDLGNCTAAMSDLTTAIRYTSPTIYKEPSVKERQYRYHILGAFVNRNCAADYDAALLMLERAHSERPRANAAPAAPMS